MSFDPRFAGVLLCFFLSGFAALIYQTAWTREFAFVFGTSELAVATVLASYMGGLAAGAAAASRFVSRVRRPVLVYGVLELGIALAALAVPFALKAATALFVAVFQSGGLGEAQGGSAALFYLAASFVILLVPTGLMGATLPLLTRYAVRSESELGSRVSLLYAINTLGAVAGTLCAGFALLPALGLRGTLHVAIAANVLVFAAAALVARAGSPLPAATDAEMRSLAPSAGRWVLPLMLISGAVSFSYEVLWSRLLGHLLGGSHYGFATMLASFLTGIALGSTVAARFASSARRAAGALAAAQAGTATLSYLAFLALDRMPELSRLVAARTGQMLLSDAAVAGATLLPGALCIGATFPLAVRILARTEADAGPASARVYAWNTLGAITGSVATGFFLLPALNYTGIVALAVGLNAALALAAFAGSGARRVPLAAATAVAAGLALWLLPPALPWKLLRSSAISQLARGDLLYLGVGRSATVLLLGEGAGWRVRTNGLPESLVLRRGSHARGDTLTQWLAAAPTLARPDAHRMLVIGFGGGVVLEGVPASIQQLDVVELEPEVIAANRRIASLRRKDPLTDPRLRLILADARGALQASRERYDVIASQPSHPWTGGASHLYTREFFALAREHLAPDGVLAQWMGIHFVDVESLRALIASLVDAFGNVRVYQPNPGSLLMLASPEPLDLERHAARALAADPRTFEAMGIFGPEAIAAALALDEDGARRFAEGAPRNTDDRNLLEMRSFAVAREPAGSAAYAEPFADFDPLLRPTPDLDRVALTRRLLALDFDERAERVADATQDPVARDTARGIVLAATGRPRAASQALERALAADPRASEARAALMRLRRAALASGDDEPLAPLGALGPTEAAVLAGWRAAERGDLPALRALEPALASVGPREPLFEECARLRIEWRAASGDAQLAAEAQPLVDALIPISVSARDEVLRARVLAAAGDSDSAVITLAQSGLTLRGRSEREREVAQEARRLVRALPDHPTATQVLDAIQRRFPGMLAAPALAGGTPAES
jgi:spermidine synthase